MSTLILVTSAPTSIYAWHALGLAQALQDKQEAFRVFFYQDGVSVANALQVVPTINVILHMHGKRYRFASRSV